MSGEENEAGTRAEIIAEIESLTARGVREVSLLGQNVNSYSGSPGGFPALLRSIHQIEGLSQNSVYDIPPERYVRQPD